jgi:hypothetical protein
MRLRRCKYRSNGTRLAGKGVPALQEGDGARLAGKGVPALQDGDGTRLAGKGVPALQEGDGRRRSACGGWPPYRAARGGDADEGRRAPSLVVMFVGSEAAR